MVGDFNFHWSTLLSCTPSSNLYFCEFIFDCNLLPSVTEPTHTKGHILDLVLSSPNVTIDMLTVDSSQGFSDHFIIHPPLY